MSAPRPYRSGLGFPEAVIIRSGPAPAPPLPPTEAVQSTLEPPLPREQAWREWAINPAHHGPERMRGPPVFVSAQGNYDELGRSMIDGVGVDVDEGKLKRDIEDGGRVAEWYTALSTATSRVASGTTTPQPARAGPSRLPVSNEVIDLTGDLDEDEEEKPTSVPGLQTEHKPTTPNDRQPTPTSTAPLRVDRNEWFIRRALLSRSQTSPQPTPITRTTSIGSMINLDNAQPRVNLPTYVLGPDNKGYELLKDRLGWEGGGLGRPEGWEAGPSRLGPQVLAGAPRYPSPPPLNQDEAGRQFTDLTIDTDSDEEGEDLGADPSRMGPGRTAPVSTALKLDRLGIGHARSGRTKAGDSLKKVTHSHEEILDAQRRARYSSKPHRLELGKKGKIKWKEKDKKERDARRRLAAALNA